MDKRMEITTTAPEDRNLREIERFGSSKNVLQALDDLVEADEKTLTDVRSMAQASLIPATESWILDRVNILLANYYDPKISSDTEMGVMAEWCILLKGLPAWALTKACQSWMMGDDRRKRPLPGDIRDLAEIDTRPSEVAIKRVNTELARRREVEEMKKNPKAVIIAEDDTPRYQPLYGKRRDAPAPAMPSMQEASRKPRTRQLPDLDARLIELTRKGIDITEDVIAKVQAEIDRELRLGGDEE